jgi:pimeloyl-ACP methyl ester carboxylesterase
MTDPSLAETYDHTGAAVHHGRYRINGIRMHAITAGTGDEAIVLLHGTPKNSFYWYKLFPLLTPHFTVVAPDLRGFGYTDKPPATNGYSNADNAHDIAELMSQLGHETYHVHGEDRGAEYAYALAALYRDRVKTLSFCEMLLTGFGLEEMSYWTQSNISAQYEKRGVWNWHLPFFWIPQLPEMLIEGKEKVFWEMFMKQECYNPSAIEPRALDHWIECVKQPGGNRGVLETYRSAWTNREVNLEQGKKKLTCPVMTVGAPEFFGPLVKECMEKVAEKVEVSEVFEECGHSLALEQPQRLADLLVDFMLKKR